MQNTLRVIMMRSVFGYCMLAEGSRGQAPDPVLGQRSCTLTRGSWLLFAELPPVEVEELGTLISRKGEIYVVLARNG